MSRYAPRPWDEAYRTQGRLWRGRRLDPWTTAFLARHPEAATAQWLDAGCGDGKGLVPLVGSHPGLRAVGADRSVWALRRAREAFNDGQVRAGPLVRADARAWPFRDDSFDVIRAVHLFGHMGNDDAAGAVAEAVRILRPAGWLLVVEFGTGDFRYGEGEALGADTFRRGVGIRTRYFTEDSLRALVDRGGLRLVRLEPERFTVRDGGVDHARERWQALLQCSRDLVVDEGG